MGILDIVGRVTAAVERFVDSKFEARLTDVTITDKPDNGEELDTVGNVDPSLEGRNYYITVNDWGKEIALGAKDIDSDGTLDVVYDRFNNTTYAPWDKYFQKAQELTRDFERNLPSYVRFAQHLVDGDMPFTTVETKQCGVPGSEDLWYRDVRSHSGAYRNLELNHYDPRGILVSMEDQNDNGWADSITFRTPDGQTRIEITDPDWRSLIDETQLKGAWLYLHSFGLI